MLFHQPSDSPKRNIWLYYAILRGDHVHLDICHWTTQSPQNGIVSNAPFWPTKLWERPIANTPRSSGRKLIGFKQRVHSLDLLHGNWNHPGMADFFLWTYQTRNPKKRGGGYWAVVFDTGWESNTRCKPKQPITTYESVYRNKWVYTLYNWTQGCIDRCQYMLWHKWNKHTNYGGKRHRPWPQ